jgi:putative chitinase
MFTLEILQDLWPHGNARVAGLVEGIASAAPQVFTKYGLTSDLLVAHAMAQFSHECGAGMEMTESIRYTVARACEVWPSRFRTPAECYAKVGSFEGDPGFPVKLIDSVYGNRLGNRPGTHDGSTFIGRGLSQCTGRENYQKLGQKTGLDLIANPDWASAAATALECGVADFIMCGCLPFAAADDVQGVTKHLNGGFVGLAQRIAWLERWKTALSNSTAPAIHTTAWLQRSLNQLGADPVLLADGKFGPMTSNALKQFQLAHNLPPNGSTSPAVFVAMDAALAAA